MKFVISREALIKPLQLVAGVVERKSTLPVLSNVLLATDGQELSLTGTDLEVELVGHVTLEEPAEPGSITVPARKLMDICKSLPDAVSIQFELSDSKLTVKAGRSSFTLSTLPATDFPNIVDVDETFKVRLPQGDLRRIIDKAAFSMAQQDVRYYLNGMLLELDGPQLRTVATDGHRLATCVTPVENNDQPKQQLIVPRKGILELARLLAQGDEEIELIIGASHVRAQVGGYLYTTKRVDATFPEYSRVIPTNGDKVMIGDRAALRQVFSRIAILSNEKYRGVRLMLEPGLLKVMANNPDQEYAEETIAVDYDGEALEISFNVNYLMDVLSILDSDEVRFTLYDSNSSALINSEVEPGSLYVVMPMRM